jgi:hypothetical protein
VADCLTITLNKLFDKKRKSKLLKKEIISQYIQFFIYGTGFAKVVPKKGVCFLNLY